MLNYYINCSQSLPSKVSSILVENDSVLTIYLIQFENRLIKVLMKQ